MQRCNVYSVADRDRLKMKDVKLTDHQNHAAWKCKTKMQDMKILDTKIDDDDDDNDVQWFNVHLQAD